jgi:hypothetical protein
MTLSDKFDVTSVSATIPNLREHPRGSASICEQSRPLRPEDYGTERPLQNRSA